METEFYPGERVLLSDSMVLQDYNNKMCTIISRRDEYSYSHYIDGFGDRAFHSRASALHRIEEPNGEEITLAALEEVLG